MIQLLIIVGGLCILVLAWKGLDKVNPIRWFIYIWLFQITLAISLSSYLALTYEGLVYIEICLICCLIGGFIGIRFNPFLNSISRFYYIPKEKNIIFFLYAILALAILTPIILLKQNGFGLSIFLNLDSMLEANSEASKNRYGGTQTTSISTQILVVFTYVAPLYGGYVYSLLKKRKWLSYLTMIPGILVAITQAVKMNLVAAILLWITGYLTYKTFSGCKKFKLTRKHLIKVSLACVFLMCILFFSMVLRTGKITPGTIGTIQQKFAVYTVGQIPVFDNWFSTDSTPKYTFGGTTFSGIANQLKLVKREQGVYQEFYPVTKEKESGSNIFTIFRFVIDDFGYTGSLVFWILFAWIATINTGLVKNLMYPVISQTVQMSIWIFILWSFATSFFAYTTFILSLVVMMMILPLIYRKRCCYQLIQN